MGQASPDDFGRGGALSFPVTSVPVRSCWIVNDNVFGFVYSAASNFSMRVSRLIDNRLLSRQGASRHVLLEDPNVKAPNWVIGFLKMPATHVGTSRERLMNETLGALCSQQIRASRNVILVGPVGLRSLELPGVRDPIDEEVLHFTIVHGCCVGIETSSGDPVLKQIAVLSSFPCSWPCECKVPVQKETYYGLSAATVSELYSSCLLHPLKEFYAHADPVGTQSSVPDCPLEVIHKTTDTTGGASRFSRPSPSVLGREEQPESNIILMNSEDQRPGSVPGAKLAVRQSFYPEIRKKNLVLSHLVPVSGPRRSGDHETPSKAF